MNTCQPENGIRSNTGDRLRAERDRLGLNQNELGQIDGVKKLAQNNYEKGERQPDALYLEAGARAGVDVLYVVTGMRQRYPVGQAQGQSMTTGLPASEPSDHRPEGLTPDVREAIRMVADELHAQRKHAKGVQFLELGAGQIVLSGALGPMAAAPPGTRIRADISALGEVSTAFSLKDTP